MPLLVHLHAAPGAALDEATFLEGLAPGIKELAHIDVRLAMRDAARAKKAAAHRLNKTVGAEYAPGCLGCIECGHIDCVGTIPDARAAFTSRAFASRLAALAARERPMQRPRSLPQVHLGQAQRGARGHALAAAHAGIRHRLAYAQRLLHVHIFSSIPSSATTTRPSKRAAYL